MTTASAGVIQTFLSRRRRLALARAETLAEQASGAVLFADISGFTPLTEALRNSLGPRQGAEALTGIINQVFEALVGQIHAHGGDVMGFAGDALLAFFEEEAGTGKDAAIRESSSLAILCATAMQGEMARFLALSTPDGQSHALSMKIGLAYGPVRRLLAGQPQAGLFDLLVGPTLDRMAAAEHQAAQGEIICAPEYPALLGSLAAWGPARQGNLPLVACNLAVALPSQPVIPDLPLESLRTYFPPALFAFLSAAPESFLAELRPVTSAFVNFAGLDYANDPVVAEKLNAYVGLAQRLAGQYAGTLIRLDYGDKGSVLHAAFGAPLAHEDDEAHAVGWALDLQAEARQFPFITAQMIGMARGQVYVGALGASARRAYTLMGDEVNASARLMQACQPWQTLVSQPVMLAAQKRYMFHQFPGFQVKGKYEPVPVAMPVAPLPAIPIVPAAPLVGREAELALLDEALNALTLGIGQLMRIEGAAGVGKSRLTVELLQRAMLRGVRTLAGSGQSVGSGSPYLAWREIIRSLFGLQEAWPVGQQTIQIQNMIQWINPEWAPRLPLLGDLLGLEIPDTPLIASLKADLRQQSLFTLLGDLFKRVSLQQPLLILIEDCHWLDDASAALFESLALSLASERVFLAATHRPPPDPSQPILPGLDQIARCLHLSLTELTPEATRLLVTARLGGQLPEALMALILERTQGNPFFVEELAETLRETSRLKMENGRWVLESAGTAPQLPDTVQKVVLARLDRLSEAARLTMKVSSVAGRRFPVNLVEGVHPARPAAEDLQAQLSDLEKREFIQPEQRYPEAIDHFKHNITHEVTYETLLYAQRRDLHRAAAGWIKSTYADSLSPHYAALAYHYQRAGDSEREHNYARLAGLQAAARFANSEALVYLSRALELTPPEDWTGRFELLAQREDIYELLGQRAAQQSDLAVLQELAEALDAQSGLSACRYQVALRQVYLAEDTADFPAALAHVEQLLALSAGAFDTARALKTRGLVLALQGENEAARAATQQALNIFQTLAGQPAVPGLAAESLLDLGELDRLQGSPQAAALHYQEALQAFQAANDPYNVLTCLMNMGLVENDQGRPEAAARLFTQAMQIARQIGDRMGESKLLNNLGLSAYFAGDLLASDGYYEQALALFRAIGNRADEGLALNNLGWNAMILGNYPSGKQYYEQALALARPLGDKYCESLALSNLGLLLHQINDQSAALECSRQAFELSQASDYTSICAEALAHQAHALAASCQKEEAAAAYQQARELYSQMEQPARVVEMLAGLARLHLAKDELAPAMELVEKILPDLTPGLIDNAEEGFRIYLSCIETLQAAGDARAAEWLQAARALLDECAARISDPALQKSYRYNVPAHRALSN